MNELKQWSEGEQTKQVTKTSRYWVHYGTEKHLDIQCGNAAFVLGYNDGDVLNAMREQPINFLRGNSGESCEANDELIKYVCEKGNWASVAWAVSGSDAVETAIAMNDSYWAQRGERKTKILSFVPGYHGTTMLAKHLRGEYAYLNRVVMVQAPNWRTKEQQEETELQALRTVRQILENNTEIGCLIMETMPWVSDISPYTKNWWQTIRNLCDEFGILFVLDDVALCWGKMGTMFGWQSYGVQPDISALGKSFTAGYTPLGAAVCNKRVSDVLSTKSWDHGHTWAPNMQGIVASLVATKKIENLLPRVDGIKQRLMGIGESLGLTYRGDCLFACYDTPTTYTLANLSSVGLAATIPGLNCIKIISPLIADDEYFGELQTRLEALVSLK